MCIHIHIHTTGRGHYFSLLFYLLFICQPFNPSPSAGRGCGVKDQLFSPPYTLFIFLSRIGSALPHRVNSRQQVDYVVYSRSHSFHGGNQTTNKKPDVSGVEPSTFPPKSNSGTPTPSARGEHPTFNPKITTFYVEN